MKIHVFSDIHLEFYKKPFEVEYHAPAGTDLVIAPGDIGSGRLGVQWLKATFKDLPVLTLAGNHEFYGQKWKIEKHYDTMREECKGSNVTFLQDDWVEIDGVKFFGSTFWTDYELYGNSPGAMAIANAPSVQKVQQPSGEWKDVRSNGMNDFKYIKTGKSGTIKRKLTPTWVRTNHLVSRLALNDFLDLPGKKVVSTHHAPSEQSLMRSKRENKDPFNPMYASNLENQIAYSDGLVAWVHGHVHERKQYEIYETTVVCNPVGYVGKNGLQETGYDPDLLIEI